MITSTGNNTAVPSSSGIRLGGNHKSHCAASPGAHSSRSAGSGRRCSGRRRVTFSRNHDDEPDQPTRSASTVAGISGNSANSSRTRGSNGVNDVTAAAARSYLGGSVESHRPRHRVARDPQPLSDPRLRHALRGQPPNQRPVLQSDHTPSRRVLTFRPAGLLSFRPSSTAAGRFTYDLLDRFGDAAVEVASATLTDCRGDSRSAASPGACATPRGLTTWRGGGPIPATSAARSVCLCSSRRRRCRTCGGRSSFSQ